jgi:hypothetical protein
VKLDQGLLSGEGASAEAERERSLSKARERWCMLRCDH